MQINADTIDFKDICCCNHGTWSVMLQSALFDFKGSEDRHLQIGHVLLPFTVGMISS